MDNLATKDRFTGSYRHSLDAKNRVTVPSRWRVGDRVDVFFAMNDKELGILKLLPRDEMEKTGQAALNRPGVTPEQAREFRRFLYGRASECPVDSQGRVLLPIALTESVGLGREVTLVGVGERVEIWHPDKWDAAEATQRATYDLVVKELGF